MLPKQLLTVLFGVAFLGLGFGNGVMALKGGVFLEAGWFLRLFIVAGLPLVGSVGFFGLAYRNHRIESGPIRYSLDSGGVHVLLTVDRDKGTSSTTNSKIVEAVDAALKVTEVPGGQE